METSWDSLTFQPYFTASASNVGFAFWSHDLGSFGGRPDPELFTRWLQWGAFSPIWRCHAGKDANNVRFPWQFDWPYYRGLRALFKLRQALLPYIYTAARRTHDTGLGVVLPVYYEWPERDEAYQFNHTYLYGERMFIAPITAPVDPNTGLVNSTHWLPPGSWVNLFTGDLIPGDRVLTLNFTLNEMPAYVQAGAIIPLLPDSAPPIGQAKQTPTAVKLVAYIGETVQGNGTMYDDAGDSEAYQGSGGYAFTPFSYTVGGKNFDTVQFSIGPATGKFDGQPLTRTWEIHLKGLLPATGVQVNGAALPFQTFLGLPLSITTRGVVEPSYYTYDASAFDVVVYLNTPLAVNTAVSLSLTLSYPTNTVPLASLTPFPGVLQRFIAAKIALDNEWGSSHTVYMDDYQEGLLLVAQMGELLTNLANKGQVETMMEKLKGLEGLVALSCKEINGGITNLRAELRTQLDAQLCHGPLGKMVEKVEKPTTATQ